MDEQNQRKEITVRGKQEAIIPGRNVGQGTGTRYLRVDGRPL